MWSRDLSRDQKLKMKEIGELVANFLCLDGISERGWINISNFLRLE